MELKGMRLGLGVVILLLGAMVFHPSGLRAQKFYQCEENETPDVKVWAADRAEEADVWVFFVYEAADLKGPGVVLQVPTKAEAEYSLSFVDVREQADFSLWIVDSKEEAGWRNQEKAKRFSRFIKAK